MSSDRRQLNVRFDSDEAMERIRSLQERMRQALGMRVSMSGVVQAALTELEKRYPPGSGGSSAAVPASPAPAEATPAPAATAAAEGATEIDPRLVPKKTGRPRKHPPKDPAEPKRPRGRPRKEQAGEG